MSFFTDDDAYCYTSNLGILGDDAADPFQLSWQQIQATCGLGIIVGLACLALFEAFRSNRMVYLRRTARLKHRAPLRPGRYPLQWLWPVLTIGDAETARMVGLDAFVCIRYLQWCLKVSSCSKPQFVYIVL